MLSIGLILLVLAITAVLLVACLQTTIHPAKEMKDGDTRAVRLLLDHSIPGHQRN